MSEEFAGLDDSQFHHDGPVWPCWRFVQTVMTPGSKLDDVWPAMDANLRRCCLQAWLSANSAADVGLDAVVMQYIDGEPDDEVGTRGIWRSFADSLIQE